MTMVIFYPKKRNGAKGVKRGQKEPNLNKSAELQSRNCSQGATKWRVDSVIFTMNLLYF
jgi:hypothetical protein